MFIDNDAFGVAAVSYAFEMFVRRVEGEDHVRAELLKTTFAIRTAAIRIHHATDCDKFARFVLCHGRTDLGDATDDLMARHDRIVRGHELAPLVADRMQIGVADPAEKNFNLNVAVNWLAPLNLC